MKKLLALTSQLTIKNKKDKPITVPQSPELEPVATSNKGKLGLYFYIADITKTAQIGTNRPDVIVNANNEFLGAGGGVDGAIQKAAGVEKLLGALNEVPNIADRNPKHKTFLDECFPGYSLLEPEVQEAIKSQFEFEFEAQSHFIGHNSKGIPSKAIPGAVFYTPAFDLKSQELNGIIHSLSPRKKDGSKFNLLMTTYLNCLILATSKEVKTLAFPLLGSGVFGWGKDESMTALNEALDIFIKNQKGNNTLEKVIIIDNNSRSGGMSSEKLIETFTDVFETKKTQK